MQKELGKELDMPVAESISRNFSVFSTQILWVETLDALLGRTVGVPMKPPAGLRQLQKEDDTTWEGLATTHLGTAPASRRRDASCALRMQSIAAAGIKAVTKAVP